MWCLVSLTVCSESIFALNWNVKDFPVNESSEGFMINNKLQQWISGAWTSTWTLFYPLHVTQPPLSSFTSFNKVFIAACFEDKALQFMTSHDGLYVHGDSGLSVLHLLTQKIIHTCFLKFQIPSQQILVVFMISVSLTWPCLNIWYFQPSWWLMMNKPGLEGSSGSWSSATLEIHGRFCGSVEGFRAASLGFWVQTKCLGLWGQGLFYFD